jgi:hypothetical protein
MIVVVVQIELLNTENECGGSTGHGVGCCYTGGRVQEAGDEAGYTGEVTYRLLVQGSS